MYNLISWYNQNRKKIWIAILTGVGVFFIAWRMVFMYGDNDQNSNIQYLQEEKNYNLNSITLSSQKSAISGQNIQVNKEEITLIDSFVSYCNTGNIEQAYNLLTNECKEEMFPNINRFKEIYYKRVFGNGKRNVKIENWYGNIYIVDFAEDALSTGTYSSENNVRDYITITKNPENNTLLNINSYIGRTQINKKIQKGDLEIKIIKKDVYMNHETYTFELKNSSEHEILLGKAEEEDTISYLIDKNNLHYNAVINELTEAQLTIFRKQTKNLQIKYYNPYGTTKQIIGLVFPKIHLIYDMNNTYLDKNIYKEYESIYIDL